jgi:hypothetical protein
MKQDRFLLGILAFIGVLVIAAIALFLFRSQAPAYGPEDTPGGVIDNYALALQKKDYARAYAYLADKPDKPTFDTFQRAFLTYQMDPSTFALQVDDVYLLANGEASVILTIQYPAGGLFDSGSSSTGRASLVQQGGAWKIISLPYPYWGFDWYTPTPLAG